NGYENLELVGSYGEDFRPLISWKYNIRASEWNPIELWLEYEKDLSCDIRIVVRNIQDGSTADFIKERIFTTDDMEAAILLDDDFSSFISVSLEAKGNGRLKIGALHQRLTRYQ
ncbi:accessory Sec system protein Asp2, partial [Streptococcus pneumoniae]|nr:accessory Sec system protein Asp2 [Streptococcus pneumoniae]